MKAAVLHAIDELLDRLLGTEYRLDDINTAYARLLAESAGRSLIVFEESL